MKKLLVHIFKVSGKEKIQIARELGISKGALWGWLTELKKPSKVNQVRNPVKATSLSGGRRPLYPVMTTIPWASHNPRSKSYIFKAA